MLACGYIRISKEDQSQYSLSYQERLIREYCTRNKLTLKAIFTDNGKSSYTFDRPDFKALEAFLKKNKDVQYLIFLDTSRFSRNVSEALMKLRELEDKMKIRVYATTDAFGTDFSDPTAFIMRTLQYVMGESELHNIRKRTRAGLLQGSLSGRFMGTAPFGYKNTRDQHDKPMLEVVEAKARIIRFIFQEFLNGMGVTEIKRQARKMGFTPDGKMAVQRVLGNAIYAGLIPIKAYKDRQSRFAQGLHTAIVSETDYWQAQEKLVHKSKIMSIRPEVPLRGALRCWCGRKMTAGNSKSHTGAYHWYYLCVTHKVNLPAKKLHKQFYDMVDGLSIDPIKITHVREQLAAEIREKLEGRQGEIAHIARDLKALQIQIAGVEKRFLTGSVSENSFQEVISELRAEESRLLTDLQNASARGPVFYSRMNEQIDRMADIRGAFDRMPLEKQHQFIGQAFDNTLYYLDGSYRTHFLHPALSHNVLILKEKGLLIIEKPTKKLWEDPRRGPRWGTDRTGIDALMELLELIA